MTSTGGHTATVPHICSIRAGESDEDRAPEDLESLGLEIVPFTAPLAEKTAHLRAETRSLGLSLGDRACLALAEDLGRPAVTTDKVWGDLNLGIEVRIIR